MATFSELLTKYTQRSGITDAELARSVGVRRQTIFRWKEGLVGRPRNREDVARCAQRLRLTPQEQDDLLLAAGFPPDNPTTTEPDAPAHPSEATAMDTSIETAAETVIETAEDAQTPPPSTDRTSQDDANDQPQSVLEPVEAEEATPAAQPKEQAKLETAAPASFTWNMRTPYFGAAILLIVSIVVALLWGQQSALQRWLRLNPPPAPTAPPTQMPIIQAADGETLLLVAQFTNYLTGANYNVSGRLQDALETQVDLVDLADVRVGQWANAIQNEDEAQAALVSSKATMIIWGEYDSGRVLVQFTTQDPTGTTDSSASRAIDAAMEQHLPSPADLSATINIEVPQQVRGLSLLTLGRLYRSQGEWERARIALEEALTLGLPDATQETAWFYLGTIYTNSLPPDLNRAIDAYTNAIDLRPNDANALYNRGKAYLERYQLTSGNSGPQDLTLALADLSRTIELKPEYAAAYNNRGIVYYIRNQEGDMPRALSDIDRAVELDSSAIEYRYNRALGHIRLNNSQAWQSDLEWVLDESPTYNSARVALCWGYALDQQPELALEQCEAALQQDPDRNDVYDSLGIAHAQLGNMDRAIENFQAYLAWLDELPTTAYAQYNGPLIESWIAALELGNNPIDATTLAELR